ncbi:MULTISPECIES: hypothetical protein [Deinococcus]|uniref:DUF805 domain-containing protein n=1 Tax=Deinococcus rufus TaxID=2136097 RepID=A0ABV7Z4A0_9DEIO|nr:hypothetical protein [Deinococcus sp. AB2017081]WQE95523.1 hypothetical protein U2P90_01180 [Deinococcus sp. AB2017081]
MYEATPTEQLCTALRYQRNFALLLLALGGLLLILVLTGPPPPPLYATLTPDPRPEELIQSILTVIIGGSSLFYSVSLTWAVTHGHGRRAWPWLWVNAVLLLTLVPIGMVIGFKQLTALKEPTMRQALTSA